MACYSRPADAAPVASPLGSEMLEHTTDEAELTSASAMLLVLNSHTFEGDEGHGPLSTHCGLAMSKGVPLRLIHWTAVSFETFFVTTPQSLVMAGLYRLVATPLFPPGPLQAVSIATLASSLGATKYVATKMKQKLFEESTKHTLESSNLYSGLEAMGLVASGHGTAARPRTVVFHIPPPGLEPWSFTCALTDERLGPSRGRRRDALAGAVARRVLPRQHRPARRASQGARRTAQVGDAGSQRRLRSEPHLRTASGQRLGDRFRGVAGALDGGRHRPRRGPAVKPSSDLRQRRRPLVRRRWGSHTRRRGSVRWRGRRAERSAGLLQTAAAGRAAACCRRCYWLGCCLLAAMVRSAG